MLCCACIRIMGCTSHTLRSAIGWYRMQTRNSAVLPRITLHDVDTARADAERSRIPSVPSLSFLAQLTNLALVPVLDVGVSHRHTLMPGEILRQECGGN